MDPESDDDTPADPSDVAGSSRLYLYRRTTTASDSDGDVDEEVTA